MSTIEAISTERALKLALEALNTTESECGSRAWEREQEAITALREALASEAIEQPAQQEPEFFTHNVEQPYDWSEWVCPDPKSYLMKCCDCGLMHEAEFGVVRYKSETEREDCDMANDPNLQAVFRMRRSEQWSPADTAHRAGGLPMEQPAQQEPVAWMSEQDVGFKKSEFGATPTVPPYTSPPTLSLAQRTWVGLKGEELQSILGGDHTQISLALTIEAKLKEKNT